MNDNNAQLEPQHEDEIDLLELAKKLWDNKRLIFKCCCVAAVIGLIIAFSIPKEYTTTVKLSPETSGNKAMGGLSALTGIGIGGNGTDAVYPELYPDIVASVPFAVDLFDVEVVDSKGQLHTTLYDYLDNHTRKTWWNVLASLPFKAISGVKSLMSKEEEYEPDGVNPARLSRDQSNIVLELNDRISVVVDKKTSVITLSVTMQDPYISAAVTDTVMMNLQEYITDYRTNKARHDLEFTQHLYDESQQNYYEAQQNYARYMDQNQNIALRSGRTEQERLQNEMNLAFNIYNQTAQQLQAARAKVQESTPVYAVVQPASVPLKASKPSKLLILVGCIFIAAVGAAAWVLFGKDIVAQLRNKE